MNWRPSLGQETLTPFSIFRSDRPQDVAEAFNAPAPSMFRAPARPERRMIPAPVEAPSESMFSIFRPKEKIQKIQASDAPAESMFQFLRPKESAKAKGNLFFTPAGPVGGDPFSAARPRPVGGDPFARMSGPGEKTCLLHNPAFWLIAAVGTFVTLEATGVTNFSKSLK